MKTRGELEAALAQAVIRFHRDACGRGPVETRGFVVDTLAVVLARGVLTPPETLLLRGDAQNEPLVRKVRQRLVRQALPALKEAAEAALGVSILGVFADFCPAADEAAFVFTLRMPAMGRGGAGGESEQRGPENGSNQPEKA